MFSPKTKFNHGMTSFLGMHSSMDTDMNREENFVQPNPCHLVQNTFVLIFHQGLEVETC